MRDGVYSERKNAVANDTKSAKKKNPKLKPSVSGFNLEKEEQGSVRMASFSAVGIKRRRSKADFESPKLQPSEAGSIWRRRSKGACG